MAPFLIDKRHVFTFVTLFLFLALLCFVGGFFLGHHYATNKTTSSTISELLLPDAESSVLLVEDYAAPVNEPGENVDVDKPDVDKIEVKKAIVKKPIVKKPIVKKAKVKKAEVKSSDVVVSSKVIAKSVEKKTIAVKKVITNAEIVSDPIEVDTPLSKIVDNATKEDARYSIQVGLYGIKINAERRVQNLINKQLSGHLTSFINNKGDTLYNVRFGYFLDMTSVNEALGIYQQKHTGEGYIIGLKK